MQLIKKIFPTPLDTVTALAKELNQLLNKHIQENGNTPFHIALSGGSTPKILFGHLASCYKHVINWELVHFWWGDERCVPPHDPESNFNMTYEHLFSHVCIPPANIHRIAGENPPEEEATNYQDQLNAVLPKKNALPCFDLIVLGMGDDGHTASIFPNQIELLKSNELCEMAEHPKTGQKRITLTGDILNNAKQIRFLVTGKNKQECMHEIEKNSCISQKYPATYIIPTHGDLVWYLDQDALKE